MADLKLSKKDLQASKIDLKKVKKTSYVLKEKGQAKMLALIKTHSREEALKSLLPVSGKKMKPSLMNKQIKKNMLKTAKKC